MSTDKRKQSLYFPEEMLKDIRREAARQDRSLSWMVQKAWKISRGTIAKARIPENMEGPSDDPSPSNEAVKETSFPVDGDGSERREGD